MIFLKDSRQLLLREHCNPRFHFLSGVCFFKNGGGQSVRVFSGHSECSGSSLCQCFVLFYFIFFLTLSAPLNGLTPPAEKSAKASLLTVLDDDQPD